jgi:hypothetical protein
MQNERKNSEESATECFLCSAGALAGMISVSRLIKAGRRWSGTTACFANYILYLNCFSNVLNNSL